MVGGKRDGGVEGGEIGMVLTACSEAVVRVPIYTQKQPIARYL